MEQDDAFDEWIRKLDEDVIQGKYGYEPGEFSVFPDHWRGLYDEGVTPLNAFKRALAAYRAAHIAPPDQIEQDT